VVERLCYTVPEVMAAACIGRTALYAEINEGRLRAVKRGARTLILAHDLNAFLAGLPEARGTAAAA